MVGSFSNVMSRQPKQCGWKERLEMLTPGLSFDYRWCTGTHLLTVIPILLSLLPYNVRSHIYLHQLHSEVWKVLHADDGSSVRKLLSSHSHLLYSGFGIFTSPEDSIYGSCRLHGPRSSVSPSLGLPFVFLSCSATPRFSGFFVVFSSHTDFTCQGADGLSLFFWRLY